MHKFLFAVYGRRVAVLYGSVCFLSVAVLTALYMTSTYSIESYVSDQLDRLPWDVAVVQSSRVKDYPELRKNYLAKDRIKQVEELGFIRLQRGNSTVGMEVDGNPLPARWLALIGTTDSALLPPQLLNEESGSSSNPDNVLRVKAALVTGSRSNDDLVDIRAGSKLELYPIREVGPDDHGHSHGSVDEHGDTDTIVFSENIPDILFEAVIADTPSQIERLDFNKWMLNQVSSLSYLPEHSLVLAIPMQKFEELVTLLDDVFLSTEGVHGGDAAPPYLPEVAHLIRLDRSQLISTWELLDSVNALIPELKTLLSLARDITPFSYLSSDLHRVLSKMADVSDMVGLVTLLIAIPLLWLAWVVSKVLGGLLLMNERRLIGLALIRGIPMNAISQTLMLSLVIGGIVGSILGLIAGLGLPVMGYNLSGGTIPPWSVFEQSIIYFPVFISLGLMVALFAGWSMIKRIRQMTPREAMARVSGNESEGTNDQLSWIYIIVSFSALILGGYKITSWMVGNSLLVSLLRDKVTEAWLQAIFVGESFLNFVAIPLFLAGVVGILRWRLLWFQYALNTLVTPFVGRLHWFVAEHMTLSRTRIANTLFITALAMSLTMLPQVTADTFYDRVIRGVDVSVGAYAQLEYSLTDLTGGKDEPAPLPEYLSLVEDDLAGIESALKKKEGITSITQIKQFVMPDVYLPSQTGLILNLVTDPEGFMRTVYYEEELGMTQTFSQIMRSLAEGSLITSSGFLKVRQVPLRSDIIFGFTDDYDPIAGQLMHVMALLPGQPSTELIQREGQATAQVDYMNYVTSSDARIFSSVKPFMNPPLNSLKIIPSRVVFLVDVESGLDKTEVENLFSDLPIKPQNIRWLTSERDNVNKDMFISLALGNMKVFMIGGLILSIAGIFVIGLANFIAERRTFSLLRLRGLPMPLLLRVSLSMFLVPVIVGIILGVLLGLVSGYGISQAIWELPRIYGVAGFLENRLIFSLSAWGVVFGFGAILSLIALGFGVWPFKDTVREAIRER